MINRGDVTGKTIYFVWNPGELNIPRFTHDIPHTHHSITPVYSWYPSGVLRVTPRCTHGIPDVLNVSWCIAQTLCGVTFRFTAQQELIGINCGSSLGDKADILELHDSMITFTIIWKPGLTVELI